MTAHFEFEIGKTHLLKLDPGDDILESITAFAHERDIRAGWVNFLGAVQRASLRYYDQEAREYRDFTLERHLEVLSGLGNISMLDGKPFVHIHAAFGDESGDAYGGHIDVGCTAFLIEVRIDELIGDPPVRQFDERVSLPTWAG